MKYSYLLMVASIGLLAGCSQIEQDFADVNSLSDGDLVEKVIFEVLPIKDGDNLETRASAVPAGGTVSFAWEENDMIGIYPNKGSQIYFKIEDGAGSSSATFDGGGWALKQNASYVSYYPFVADFFLSRDEIPVSFVGQKQVGTSSPFHGARYYLATESTSSENGVLRFSYKTLNTIINVNATLPAGTYTKMSLTIEDPLFVEEGTYSLDERTIVGTKFSNTLEIELEDVTLTDEATIPIYIMSAPVDLREKEVVVCFAAADGSSYKCIKTPTKEYKAGTRYGLTCNEMERENHPNNVIFYTSSDGNIVTPNAPYVFGANIVSNEYVEGRGVLIFDSFVAQIGNEAFRNCTNLVSISIHDGIDYIGHNAFEGCSNLTGISIPNGVQWIGTNAFAGCTSLTDVDISDSVTGIYSGIFKGCTSLSSITIPDSVTWLAEEAFSGCINLIDVVLPQYLSGIGSSYFYDCSKLPRIVLPDGTRRINSSAFYGCENLSNITLPDGVKVVDFWAFGNCTSFTHFVFPESVTEIGMSVLNGCSNLMSITVLSETPPRGDMSMFDNTNDCPIFVPAGSVDAYKAANRWDVYADRIQAIPSPIPVPEAIDLGLPSGIKWASFNLGASKPEEYGDYYAWGETEPYYSNLDPLTWKEGKDEGYWWPSYRWCMGSDNTMTKYCSNSSYGYNGFVDGKTVLDPEDDASHIYLGDDWRMPTDAEWTELRENCTWTWAIRNGINGMLVSATNGNSIFLPSAGYCFELNCNVTGTSGHYWSSTPIEDEPRGAWRVSFSSDSVNRNHMGRINGYSIRPVYAE